MPDDKSTEPKPRTGRRRFPHGLGFFELERTIHIDEQGNSQVKLKVLTHIPLEPFRRIPAMEITTEEQPSEEQLSLKANL